MTDNENVNANAEIVSLIMALVVNLLEEINLNNLEFVTTDSGLKIYVPARIMRELELEKGQPVTTEIYDLILNKLDVLINKAIHVHF